MNDSTFVDGYAFFWIALLCLPYAPITVKKWRYNIVSYFTVKKLHKNLIEGFGLVLFPILIDIFSTDGHNNISVGLIVSFFIFIALTIYLNFSVEKKIEDVVGEKQGALDKLNLKYSKLKNGHDILLKFNKLERYVEEIIKVKSGRFLDSYKKFKKSEQEIKGTEIFNTITRPDLQLKELYGIIKRFFEDIFCHDDEELEYSIMEPKGEQLQFIVYSKRPRSLDSSEYKSGNAFKKGSGYTASAAW